MHEVALRLAAHDNPEGRVPEWQAALSMLSMERAPLADAKKVAHKLILLLHSDKGGGPDFPFPGAFRVVVACASAAWAAWVACPKPHPFWRLGLHKQALTVSRGGSVNGN